MILEYEDKKKILSKLINFNKLAEMVLNTLIKEKYITREEYLENSYMISPYLDIEYFILESLFPKEQFMYEFKKCQIEDMEEYTHEEFIDYLKDIMIGMLED